MPTTDVELYHDDCLNVMGEMLENSVDSIVTDPPYGLKFMGKEWDHGVPGVPFWKAALRVAKPGAMLLAFGGTRTWHRLACAIEDAGWLIRDTVMYVYGQGFPKSHDISKAIDKVAGAEREVVGANVNYRPVSGRLGYLGQSTFRQTDGMSDITAPATPDAQLWDGWGTALKPAYEPIIMAMAPLDGTFAHNALEWGVAGLNVDGCRVPTDEAVACHGRTSHFSGGNGDGIPPMTRSVYSSKGRWPANLVLGWPEDEYELRSDVTPEQLRELAGWLDENA